MKKLYVYYSLTGNGDIVADYLNKKGFSICKVISKERLPKNKILQIIVGGYKALKGHKDIIEVNVSFDDYDEIIIGSPIWNSRLSSPVLSLLNMYDFSKKKTSFILYSGSGKDNKATHFLKEKYKNFVITNLKEPKNNTEELKKLEM